MKIEVKNLGVIEEGEVDLGKKINIFCGYNGTGKTYYSYLIYGLLKRREHLLLSRNDFAIESSIGDGERNKIDFNILSKYREMMIREAKNEIDEVFGVGYDVAREIFSKTELFFKDSESELMKQVIDAEISKGISIIDNEYLLRKKAGEDFYSLRVEKINIKQRPRDEFYNRIVNSFVYRTLATIPVGDVCFFPVERNSIYTFSKELSITKQETFDTIQRLFTKERKKISRLGSLLSGYRYTLPVKDGLMVADDLANIRKRRSFYYEFATELEKKLLKGELDITEEGDIKFLPDEAKTIRLPIQLTASVVKTLSSLVVYLKHMANKNDLLIIDEPEINLHPLSQIALMRLFARLANSGFRFIISTHSDYIMREINNLTMISQLDAKDRKCLGYADGEYLEQEDVAVNNFMKTGNAVNIVRAEIDDSGFSFEQMDEAIMIQNELAARIYGRLKKGSDE